MTTLTDAEAYIERLRAALVNITNVGCALPYLHPCPGCLSCIARDALSKPVPDLNAIRDEVLEESASSVRAMRPRLDRPEIRNVRDVLYEAENAIRALKETKP